MSTFGSIASLLLAAASSDALDLAPGQWEMHPEERGSKSNFSCNQEPLTITIDRTAMRYTSTRDDYTVVGDILAAEDQFFIIRYDGEERLDDNGEPLVWIWLSIDKDTFVWARLDQWMAGNRGTTAPRLRCRPNTPPGV
ncbi:MAG: hypothetical protein AAF830_10835 [Pseudomonadota bacterium]